MERQLHSTIVWQWRFWASHHSYKQIHWSLTPPPCPAPPPHLLVFVYYSMVICQPFTQSFCYFLWWRLCFFPSSSSCPGLNIARLFVCVVGNWSDSKPPPPSILLLLGEGSGGWPLASQLPPVIILECGRDAAGREPGASPPPSALWQWSKYVYWLSCLLVTYDGLMFVLVKSGTYHCLHDRAVTMTDKASNMSQHWDHFLITWVIFPCKQSQLPSKKEKPFCCCHLASENLCFFSGFDLWPGFWPQQKYERY